VKGSSSVASDLLPIRKALTNTGVCCEACPTLFVVHSWFWQLTPFAPLVFACPAAAVPEVLEEFDCWLAMPIFEVVEESRLAYDVLLTQKEELGLSVEE
jgi:hypothetical protein